MIVKRCENKSCDLYKKPCYGLYEDERCDNYVPLTTDSDGGAEVALDCGVSTLYILQKHWLGDWVDVRESYQLSVARENERKMKATGDVTTRVIKRTEEVC